MKTASLKRMFRIVGILLLLSALCFSVFSLGHHITVGGTLFESLTTLLAVYFSSGAPHLIRKFGKSD
jgi:hypothetical protein